MDLYGATLLLALLVLGLATLSVANRVARRGWRSPADGLERTATVGALLLGLLSLVAHFALDHTPGTARALAPAAFARSHSLSVLIPVVALALVAISRLASAEDPSERP